MRVSEFFKLGRTQPTLDFVDVDIYDDVKMFVDPRALLRLPSAWGQECVGLIQHFFGVVLRDIRAGRDNEARQLLGALREPNETHLGLSQERSRGRGVGDDLAESLWNALKGSAAVKSGLLQNLEDTILMIPGIAEDIVSDIATNIIRQPLIAYTQHACRTYAIPMDNAVDSGPFWDPNQEEWRQQFTQLPTINGSRLLLIPKAIVRRRMDYEPAEYYRDYILEFLRQKELDQNTALVELLKNGKRRVTIKALKQKYGEGKQAIYEQSLEHPEILKSYRRDKDGHVSPPLSHEALAESMGTPPPNWQQLIDAVLAVPTGRDHATAYERAIEQLLTALFYPALSNPRIQNQIHNGRKRIDIAYDNMAEGGLFRWLSLHFRATEIQIECKNYASDPANPELDQLAGRFSQHRGQIGFLVCRTFQDKPLFMQRCIDTAHDHRGFIVPLDDDDLHELTNERLHPDTADSLKFKLIEERIRQLL